MRPIKNKILNGERLLVFQIGLIKYKSKPGN